MPQINTNKKVFVIERLKYLGAEGNIKQMHKVGYQEYRLCYYIVGKIGNKNNKWTWGQFSPHFPLKDFSKFIRLAKKRKVIIQVNN